MGTGRKRPLAPGAPTPLLVPATRLAANPPARTPGPKPEPPRWLRATGSSGAPAASRALLLRLTLTLPPPPLPLVPPTLLALLPAPPTPSSALPAALPWCCGRRWVLGDWEPSPRRPCDRPCRTPWNDDESSGKPLPMDSARALRRSRPNKPSSPSSPPTPPEPLLPLSPPRPQAWPLLPPSPARLLLAPPPPAVPVRGPRGCGGSGCGASGRRWPSRERHPKSDERACWAASPPPA